MRRLSPRFVPFDFYGTCSSSTKELIPSDIGLSLNRSVRPYRAQVSASIAGSSQYSVMSFAMHDTENDIIGVSLNRALSGTT